MDEVITTVDISVAKPFIEKWHYSKKCPTGKNIFFGWFSKGQLYAIADYGIGVNPYQASYLSRLLQLHISNDNLLELKRLCRIEPKNDNMPLTKFLSKCHKRLKLLGYKYIVSFSDPQYGHSGGIYKAANFTNIGKTNAERHVVDSNGNIRHRRLYFRYSERRGISVKEAREELNLKVIKTLPKDRWFITI